MTSEKAVGKRKRERLKLHSPGMREEKSSIGGLREWWKRMNFFKKIYFILFILAVLGLRCRTRAFLWLR